jgi:hypothetical protein
MNRAELFRAVDLAHCAAHNATLAASYGKIKPERAEYFARLSEDALNAALDALFEARLGHAPSFFPIAEAITQPVRSAA